MTPKPLTDMTVDELDQLNAGLKGQVAELNEKRQMIAAIRRQKVEKDRAKDAREAEGKPGVVVGIGGTTVAHEGDRAAAADKASRGES